MEDPALGQPSSDDPPIAQALREQLVRTVGLSVSDSRVLAVLREVPRHLFVGHHDLELAYADQAFSIGYHATISQPSVVGIMTAALELDGDERVLEIGAGSGYQTAVLGRLARHVDSVEVIPQLAARAAAALASQGYTNVDVHTGDGWAGWPAGAPYDRVVVTAAPDVLPPALLEQLADGGLLVVPVGPQARDQRLERWCKRGGGATREDLGAVRFVPMIHGG
jgi:protein-L-isoaspartate(D-aspartate) O-methyltransferase